MLMEHPYHVLQNLCMHLDKLLLHMSNIPAGLTAARPTRNLGNEDHCIGRVMHATNSECMPT